jgi:hypothetical protein
LALVPIGNLKKAEIRQKNEETFDNLCGASSNFES